MPNIPYVWTLATGVVSVLLAFWTPLGAWLPLLLRETYFVYLLARLRKLKVKHIPQISEKANELLRRHPQYYWQPAAGTMYRQAASLSGVLGLVIGVIGAVKGTWVSVAIAIANLAAMMALAPRFDPTNYLTPEYAAAHDELIAYVLASARETHT